MPLVPKILLAGLLMVATLFTALYGQTTVDGQKKTIKWQESAVLETSKGAWKGAMLQSTVLARKN